MVSRTDFLRQLPLTRWRGKHYCGVDRRSLCSLTVARDEWRRWLTKTLTPSDLHCVVCSQAVDCMDLCAAQQQIIHYIKTRAINVPCFTLRTITLKFRVPHLQDRQVGIKQKSVANDYAFDVLREASFDYYLHYHWEDRGWKSKEVSWKNPGAPTSVSSAGAKISGNV